MKININDIPPQGRDLSFSFEAAGLNERVRAARQGHNEREEVLPPDYAFLPSPEATVHLEAEGKTIVVTGKACAVYKTPCSRCAEDTEKRLEVSIQIVLKPHSPDARADDEAEDLHLGFYDGIEVDCGSIAEEFLILSLPYSVVCSEDCKGLCPVCGQNRNSGTCSCQPHESSDPRFAVLRDLKLQ